MQLTRRAALRGATAAAIMPWPAVATTDPDAHLRSLYEQWLAQVAYINDLDEISDDELSRLGEPVISLLHAIAVSPA